LGFICNVQQTENFYIFTVNKIATLFLTLTICTFAFANKETFTDPRDGKEYKVKRIGRHKWFLQDIAYEKGNKEGKYEWAYAIFSCPDGWRLPDYDRLFSLREANAKDLEDFFEASAGDWWTIMTLGSKPGSESPFVCVYGTELMYKCIEDRSTVFSVRCVSNFEFDDLKLNDDLKSKIDITISKAETFTDPRDDKEYKVKRIGKHKWFLQNLAYRKKEYTWDEALAACPNGWRLPSDSEWESLNVNTRYMVKAGAKYTLKVGIEIEEGIRNFLEIYGGIGWWSATQNDSNSAPWWHGSAHKIGEQRKFYREIAFGKDTLRPIRCVQVSP
jgi:hypothetical protein